MADNLPNLVDSIDTDAIRNGDALALTDALSRIFRGVNDSITQLAQLRQQAALTPLYCRLYHASATQSIANNTDTYVEWETPTPPGDLITGINIGGMFDPAGAMVDGANGNQYIALREAGLYLIEANILWDTNVTGDRSTKIILLGTSLTIVDQRRDSASVVSALGLRQTVQALVPWRALGGAWDGRIAIQVFQDSGGARTIGGAGATFVQWIAVTRIGAVR